MTTKTAAWTPFQPPGHIKVMSGGDAVPGGYNGYYVAYEQASGKKMGYLDYQSAKVVEETEVGTPVTTEHVTIAMVEVEPEFRRQGVATVLLDALRNDFPDAVIDPGMTTPEGTAWWSRVGGLQGDLPDLRYEHLRGHLIGDDGPEPTDSGIDTLVAYDGGRAVGHISWMTREGWTKGSVDALGVDDDYRRRGIATELLRRARQIEPEVNPRNTPWFTDDGEAWVNTVASKTASVVPFEGETIYRGLALPWSAIEEAEGTTLEEFFSWPPGDIASWIIDKFDGTGIGHHWSTVYNVSYKFANEVAGDIDGFPVVIEGTYASGTVDLETDPDVLEELNVYVEPDNPEKEVTIQEGSLIPVRKVYWLEPDGMYGRWREARPSWNNSVTAAKTAGPADDYIPGHMRGPAQVARTEMPMPRPVVVDRPAEEDLEGLPPAMRQKVVDAVRDIEDGSAPLEAKTRELTGVYTMRLSNAWRAAFYMGREGFWHLMYVGPHDYTEVTKRWSRTSAKKTSAMHTVTTGDYKGISFEYHEKHRGENGQEYLLIREPTSITARTPDGRTAGYLTVVVSTNEIGAVNVVSQHRRQGLATAMLRMAREQFPGLAHTTVPGQLSPDGEAWARVVGSRTFSGGTIYRGLRANLPPDVDSKVRELLAPEMDVDSYERWKPHGGKKVQAGELIVRALEKSHWDSEMGLGRHWSERKEMADIAARQGGAGDWGILLTATYRPEDIDPDWDPDAPFMEAESEVRLRPGAQIEVTAVELRSVVGYDKVSYQPIRARASVSDPHAVL